MDVRVRAATSDDGAELLPLWRGLSAHLSAYHGRYAASEGAARRWIAYFEEHLVGAADAVVLLAEAGRAERAGDGGGPVGVLQARVVEAHPIFRLGRRGRIDGLFVREDARNRGVGRALLYAAEAWFAEDPRGVDFYRIDAVAGDEATAGALRGLDLTPVSRTYEGDARGSGTAP